MRSLARVAGSVGALVWALSVPSAEAYEFELSLGFDFSKGDYGERRPRAGDTGANSGPQIDTETLFFPIGLSWRTGPWRFGATIPFLIVEGPTNPGIGGEGPRGGGQGGGEGDGGPPDGGPPGDGPPPRRTVAGPPPGGCPPPGGGPPPPGCPGPMGDGPPPDRAESGIGDITLQLGYSPESLARRGWFTELSAELKLPTADENRSLGTGETDLGLAVEVSRPLDASGDWVPFAMVGYRFVGGTDVFDLQDTFISRVGVDRRLTERMRGGVSFDYRQSISRTGQDPRELMSYVSYVLDDHWTLVAYGMVGFSDGSPDAGSGFLMRYRTLR